MQDKPKISIISPSKNTGRFTRETIESILAQTYKNWEHIIVDGVSTDETLNVFLQYPHIRWISERDTGPDEAFRKGLTMAKGEYIMLCCISDGYLDKNWFKKCVEILDSKPEISLVWGVDQNMLEDGTLHEIICNDFFRNPPLNGRSFFYHWLRTGMLFPERNFCVRKNVIDECLPAFDPDLVHERSSFIDFSLVFNMRGYLPYFIPSLAAYGRVHIDSAFKSQVVNGDIQRSLKRYHRAFEQFKNENKQNEHHFRDGSGELLPGSINLRKHFETNKENKFGKIVIYLIPPIFIWFKNKLLNRYRVYQNIRKINRDLLEFKRKNNVFS